MTVVRTQIEQIRSRAGMRIEAVLEEMILAPYRTEPQPYTYSEQDSHEQIRKLIDRYNHQHPDPALVESPTPWKRNTSPPDSATDTGGGTQASS